MSARVPTTEVVANIYEVGDGDKANYRRRTARRQAFFAWLAAHDAEVIHAAALHLRSPDNPRQVDNSMERVHHVMDDAGYELIQYAKRLAEGAGVVAEEPEWGACYQADNGHEPLWFPMGNSGFAIREAAEKEVERYADTQIVLCRRRKAGPWVPVKQEGADDVEDAD